MNKKIYIAGPMSGLADYNYPAFDYAEGVLCDMDLDVVNPARLGRELLKNNHHPSYADYLRVGITALINCNVVVLLPGWEKSNGAKLEKLIAENLEMQILRFEDMDYGDING